MQPQGVRFDGTNIWLTTNSNSVINMSITGNILGSYIVGTNPQGIGFDGSDIWVANAESNNVTELKASDGANSGTYFVGTSP